MLRSRCNSSDERRARIDAPDTSTGTAGEPSAKNPAGAAILRAERSVGAMHENGVARALGGSRDPSSVCFLKSTVYVVVCLRNNDDKAHEMCFSRKICLIHNFALLF